ncbi:MAG TPA: c-type cytochrome [Bryobacteraceae bacterium]|jgi:mono/diheme cytochrome c family protein|nr:c-type cytochrome [Bryobacteraceae bacterium]
MKLAGFLCALLAAASLTAQTPAPTPTPPPTTEPSPVPARPVKFDQASVDRGQKTFVATCGFCHGTHAKGGEKGPDLLRSVLVLDDEGGKSIGQVIRKGRPEKGMPKFNLPPEQIVDIANFLHSSIATAADRDKYQVLNIVTGDAKAGQAYFNGAGRCSTCHSVTGDLKGIGAKYEPVTLQDHIVAPPDHWGDPQAKPLITLTVTLPSGQSFTGVPVRFDDFTVALRETTGDYHSFTRLDQTNPRVEIHNRLQAHSDLLMRYTDADIHNLTAYLVTLK